MEVCGAGLGKTQKTGHESCLVGSELRLRSLFLTEIFWGVKKKERRLPNF